MFIPLINLKSLSPVPGRSSSSGWSSRRATASHGVLSRRAVASRAVEHRRRPHARERRRERRPGGDPEAAGRDRLREL